VSRMACGWPRQAVTCSSTRITRSAGKEVSTSIAKTSRTSSSRIFKVRNRRPPYNVSLMKSSAHTTLGWGITSIGCTGRTGSRFLVRRGRLSRSRQYTRHRRLWFQRCPVSRSQSTYFQNPQRGFVVANLVSASITAASRRAQSTRDR
jgi:hypothetical protein